MLAKREVWDSGRACMRVVSSVVTPFRKKTKRIEDPDKAREAESVRLKEAQGGLFRSSMLGRLLEMPRARALLPFARMSHA